MKLVAFYLPQFHEIPENNDTWGKGFTEWTNVRKAHALYLGHYQPRVPLHNNYYDLLDVQVMEWQDRLARKAGIYGFCFYHYWFQGRMVLEKPVENWLNDKKITTHFCFAWANEPWTKTWHGAGGNKEILISQTYGGQEEWRQHYDYFRSFFIDTRYIKVQNKPMLLIYKLKNIPHYNRMISFWNECAQQDGFNGVYIVSMNTDHGHMGNSKFVHASVDFEPNRTKYKFLLEDTLEVEPKEKSIFWNRYAMRTLNYDAINRKMLKDSHKKDHFRTAFIGYDDTPRRNLRGLITVGESPHKFEKYLKKIIQLSIQEGNEFVFINAWNEWGEGNYLEPDMRYQYAYLRAVKNCISNNNSPRQTRKG